MNEQNFNNLGQNQSNNLNEQPASQNPEPTIQTQTVGESVNNSVNTNLNSTPVTNNVSDTISMSNNPQNNPVATPIPGTENNNMPNMGSSIGQDPGGISLGNINNNGFVEPTKVEDIGAVPPKQEKPKRPMNKVLFTIIIVILIGAVAFGVYYYLNMANNKVNVQIKDVTLGLGETLSDDINDYATITGGGAATCEKNINNVNTNALGDYNFTITCGEDTYTGTIHVVDKTAPTAQLKTVYKVINTTTISVDDFIVSCTDPSNCKYAFSNKETVNSYLSTAGGPYNVGITLSDDENNSKEVNAILYVSPSDITAIRSCTSLDSEIEGYSGSMTTTDNLVLGATENGLGYLEISQRIYTYKFSNNDDYIQITNGKPETITFNNISGLAEYDDENYTLKIATDLSASTLDTEAGGVFDRTYSGLKNYYDQKNYTCINIVD